MRDANIQRTSLESKFCYTMDFGSTENCGYFFEASFWHIAEHHHSHQTAAKRRLRMMSEPWLNFVNSLVKR